MTDNQSDSRAESDALRALEHFTREEYDAAARHYQAALERDPHNEALRAMHAVASANAIAKMGVPMPDVHYLDGDAVLAPPTVRPGSLPDSPAPVNPPTILTRLRRVLGDVLGAIISAGFDGVTWLWGTITNYSDRVWTNWYTRPLPLGVLTLAHMRERLNTHNLVSTYPAGSLVGFQKPDQSPPPGVRYFRTADGSWNNLEDPMEGAAGTRFPRNVPAEASRPETGDTLLSPNPREVSRTLLTRGKQMKEVAFLNMLAAVWIQFQNHDWITHGENLSDETIAIPLREDDPARRRYGITEMVVGRTQVDPTRRPEDRTPRTFINEVTHWWDGSQIYGSDQETQDRLRSTVDGKMTLHDDGTLPLDATGVEDSGMVRNWWVGLSMVHLLFVKEHNAICDLLKSAYPEWDDTRLFNTARLINAAVTAKIHSVEWTPAILPNASLDLALNANWYGILTNLFRRGQDRKTLADINVRNPEMGGVVGNPIDNHGSPYGLTEEFVEVYRLHSLLPETLHLQHLNGDGPAEDLPFPASRQAGSRRVTERIPMADLFYSFGNQQPGALEINNYPTFLQALSVPGRPFLDMGAVDILRARERGVPRYNEFRRQLGLNPIHSFDDLTDDTDCIRKLKKVYGSAPEDVDKLDLLAGTLSEGHRPNGFGFGETLFQIFILNATRRLQADRFYTDCYNEETYTQEGLEWIDHTDLKAVLLRHYPELAATGLGNVTNAFEPWDTTARLNPTRHPLRAYDTELKNDPWRGNAYR